MEIRMVSALWTRFSYRNATILVCFFNLVTALLLLQGFLNAANISKRALADHNIDPVQLRYILESIQIRREMEPLHLIKRVREIEQEAFIDGDAETALQVVPKQTAAVDLSKRLHDFQAMNDAKNQKALEEWRLRKMERARQREIEKNGTSVEEA